jgi:hypothetical protein
VISWTESPSHASMKVPTTKQAPVGLTPLRLRQGRLMIQANLRYDEMKGNRGNGHDIGTSHNYMSQ